MFQGKARASGKVLKSALTLLCEGYKCAVELCNSVDHGRGPILKMDQPTNKGRINSIGDLLDGFKRL